MSIRSLIGALLFGALLELPIFWGGAFVALSFAAVIGAAVVAWYGAQKIRVALLALLLGLLAVLLLSFFSSTGAGHAVVVSATLLFYALLYGAERRRPVMLTIVSFCELLGFYFLVLAAHVFAQMPTWIAMLAVFYASGALFFISLSVTLALSFGMELRLILFSAVMGLLSAELFVALSKLPFNIVSIDFLLFIIYYGAWDIVLRYFSLRFTKRSLALHVVLIAAAFLAVFLSSR